MMKKYKSIYGGENFNEIAVTDSHIFLESEDGLEARCFRRWKGDMYDYYTIIHPNWFNAYRYPDGRTVFSSKGYYSYDEAYDASGTDIGRDEMSKRKYLGPVKIED